MLVGSKVFEAMAYVDSRMTRVLTRRVVAQNKRQATVRLLCSSCSPNKGSLHNTEPLHCAWVIRGLLMGLRLNTNEV
jgi:hypothetical protein